MFYISTPYTLFPKGRQAAFEEAAIITARLLDVTGDVCFSPIVHCHPLAEFGGLDPLDMKRWLPFCEIMLSKCDTLIVAHMESWENSSGIAYEIDRAWQWKMPVFDCDPKTLTMSRRITRSAA